MLAVRVSEARRHSVAEAAIVLAVLTWGLGTVLIKVTGFPGLTFAFYRLWLGFIAMFVVLRVSGRRLTWRTLLTAAPGGVLLGLDVTFFFVAVKETSVADATIIGALQPVLVLLVAGRWFGERVGRREVMLVLLSLVGVAVVAVGSSGSPVFSVRGDLLASCALLAWTGYWLVSKRTRSRLPALEYMTGVLLTASLVITPVMLVSGSSFAATKPSDWLWLALFVLFPSTTGQAIVAWAHRYVEVWMSSLLLQGMPVVASVAAFVVLGEPLTPLVILGGALVVVATGSIIVLSRSRAGAADDEHVLPLADAPPL
jgi:drug/metabolite transporter (DMT)-like permease